MIHRHLDPDITELLFRLLFSSIFVVLGFEHLFSDHLILPLMPDWQWIWDLYQRSNFIKNVCLLGVCFHFLYHEPGQHSLDRLLVDRARHGSERPFER